MAKKKAAKKKPAPKKSATMSTEDVAKKTGLTDRAVRRWGQRLGVAYDTSGSSGKRYKWTQAECNEVIKRSPGSGKQHGNPNLKNAKKAARQGRKAAKVRHAAAKKKAAKKKRPAKKAVKKKAKR